MRLQTNTLLALYSLIEFAAEPTRHIPAAQVAAKYGVSLHHLAKVLAELTRAGLVESVRGVGGGYRFVGNARRLTLLDVIQRFEDLSPAQAAQRVPPDARPVERALDSVLSEIDALARATFGSITLSTMLSLVARQAAAPAARQAAPGRSKRQARS